MGALPLHPPHYTALHEKKRGEEKQKRWQDRVDKFECVWVWVWVCVLWVSECASNWALLGWRESLDVAPWPSLWNVCPTSRRVGTKRWGGTTSWHTVRLACMRGKSGALLCSDLWFNYFVKKPKKKHDLDTCMIDEVDFHLFWCPVIHN